MDNRKTVLVTTAYFPPNAGGSARYAFESSVRLANEYDWKVFVVATNRSPKDTREEMRGMEIHRLSFSKIISNTPVDLLWIWKIRKLIKETKPEVIVIHTPVIGIGDIASFWAGRIPTIVVYHTCGSMVKNDSSFLDVFIKIYERLFLHLMFKRAQSIVCSSDFVRFNFLRRYMKKSITLASAVDHETFVPDESKKPSSPTVLFVSNLNSSEKYKGLSVLLEAFKILIFKIPEIKLKIVGDGDMLEAYKIFVQKNGLANNVEFLGKLSGKDLTEAYQKAHIFALPTSYDSLPNVVLEAMSTGLPIVTTSIGDLPLVVAGDEKAGFIVSPITPQGFAEKIQKLFEDQDLYQEFSKNSRKVILEKMSWHKRAEGFDEVMQKIAFSNSTAKAPRKEEV